MHAATSKVENSAQGSSCQLKFVHEIVDLSRKSVTKFAVMIVMNLVTPKAAAKLHHLLKKQPLRWVCWTTKLDLRSTTKCDQYLFENMNLVAPKVGAKHDLLFNKAATGFHKDILVFTMIILFFNIDRLFFTMNILF